MLPTISGTFCLHPRASEFRALSSHFERASDFCDRPTTRSAASTYNLRHYRHDLFRLASLSSFLPLFLPRPIFRCCSRIPCHSYYFLLSFHPSSYTVHPFSFLIQSIYSASFFVSSASPLFSS